MDENNEFKNGISIKDVIQYIDILIENGV